MNLFLSAFLLTALVSYLVVTLAFPEKKALRKALGLTLAVFFIGAVLRTYYASVTGPAMRSQDAGGHIKYVTYLLDHATMPPSQNGWEFHQAPLYYMVTAAWISIWKVLGITSNLSSRMFAWLLSIVTLAFGIRIGKQLFPGKDLPQVLFGLIIAVFPGLIFFASRISNDALLHCLGFVFISFLLNYWKDGSDRYLVYATLALGLACITKMTAYLFLPVLLVAILLQNRPHTRIPWRQLLLSFGLIALMAGWYPLVRINEARTQRFTTFGSVYLPKKLYIGNQVRDYLVFNPGAMVQFPFNDTWTELKRRRNFLEFAWRSTFFGEFVFPKVRVQAVTMLALSLLLLPWLGAGFAYALKTMKQNSILLATFVCLSGGLFLYRFLYAYACNQDFRFIVPVLIPIAAFGVYGLLHVKHRWLYYIGLTITVAFCVSASVFILSL